MRQTLCLYLLFRLAVKQIIILNYSVVILSLVSHHPAHLLYSDKKLTNECLTKSIIDVKVS